MISNIDKAYHKIRRNITHTSFICFIFGYMMGLLNFWSRNYIPLVIENAIIIGLFIITYLVYLLKRISLEYSMMILSFLVVVDMLYPNIIFTQSAIYVDSPEKDIIMFMNLVFVIAFTTNRIYAIIINIIINAVIVACAIISENTEFIESLPTIILCLLGMGIFSIVFEKLIKNLLIQADVSQNKIKELSNYKQNVIRLIIHDLKVPVNTILNLSKNSENGKMKTINNHVENINNQLENVLDIERLQEPKISLYIKEISVKKVVKNAIRAVEILAHEKNIRIELSHTTEFNLLCDISLIERTIINLLTNAIKHSSTDSQIIVEFEIENQLCKIAVKDNGTGIAEQHLDNIFKKFYFVSPEKSKKNSSTGLGLAFCKLAIEAHGGKIAVKSKLGRGTEVEIFLPDFNLINQLNDEAIFNSKNIAFTYIEKKRIEQICIQIKDIPIYKIGEIVRQIENHSENLTENIIQWKKIFIDAVYTGDQKLVDEMIKPYIVPIRKFEN